MYEKHIDESTSVEDASERKGRHDRGRGKRNSGERTARSYERLRGAKQRPTVVLMTVSSASTRSTSHAFRFFTPRSTRSSSTWTHTQAWKWDIH